MVRNYMQDIEPEGNDPIPSRSDAGAEPTRSIRNIMPTRARPTRRPPEIRDAPPPPPEKRRGRSVWVLALISLVVLGGAAAFIFLPSTSVAIEPRVQVVPFDALSIFTASPQGDGTTGITYRVVTETFEDSAVVPANGVEHAEEKATGVVTVYNEYSTDPVKLIKNTRFQTSDGLIFRIPASVDVPGMRGTTPGSIEVTVFADQTGENYNIGPTDKFTIPGLRSTPEMYTKVYARSTTAFSGGFSGDRPAVSTSVLEAARAEVRGRLNEKAQTLHETVGEGSIAFPGLMRVSFETLPPSMDGSSVRINERAVVKLAVLDAAAFAQTIGQAVSADAEGQSVRIRFSDDVVAQTTEEVTAADIGANPLEFSLSGRAQLIWNIDAAALSEALAGRDESAFETIVQGFPAIERAEARITPLWSSSFPKDPQDIKIDVADPAPTF